MIKIDYSIKKISNSNHLLSPSFFFGYRNKRVTLRQLAKQNKTKKSLHFFTGKEKYNDWSFILSLGNNGSLHRITDVDRL